eukprot:c4287_g1_i1.p1 GENE.c4287_g1_i1~~c4287_g1_i1.p1  ORF type:complete len:386 (+),score=85.65 c4287_g1_i1:151-1308(+)
MQPFVVLLFKFVKLRILQASRFGRIPTVAETHQRFEPAAVLSRRMEDELDAPDSVFVFAGALVQRLRMLAGPNIFQQLCAAEIVAGCYLLAVKFVGEEVSVSPPDSDDEQGEGPTVGLMRYLGGVMGIPVRHLAWVERKVFHALKFSVHVSTDEYTKALRVLTSMASTAFACLNVEDPFGMRIFDRPLRHLHSLERELDQSKEGEGATAPPMSTTHTTTANSKVRLPSLKVALSELGQCLPAMAATKRRRLSVCDVQHRGNGDKEADDGGDNGANHNNNHYSDDDGEEPVPKRRHSDDDDGTSLRSSSKEMAVTHGKEQEDNNSNSRAGHPRVGWDTREDEWLLALVRRHGEGQWTYICLFFDSRTSADCCLRFDQIRLAQQTPP